MALSATIARVATLQRDQVRTMYRLMDKYYDNVHSDIFEEHLSRKDWVILLYDRLNGDLCGFSTQVLLEHNYEDQDYLVMFSGDTVIKPEHWGSLQLPITLGQMMMVIRTHCPERKLYWLLLSKGIRTYRFLPTFFHSFHPHYAHPTPAWEDGFMNSLGTRMFSDRFDKQAGIVRAWEKSEILKKQLAVPMRDNIRKNPHIEFFLTHNSDYRSGDELLCIAPFFEENLRPFILRELKRGVPVDFLSSYTI